MGCREFFDRTLMHPAQVATRRAGPVSLMTWRGVDARFRPVGETRRRWTAAPAAAAGDLVAGGSVEHRDPRNRPGGPATPVVRFGHTNATGNASAS